MSAVGQAIILAAGRGHQVDGMAKVLIRHPATGKSILEHAVEAFAGKRVIVVVGFRAVHVMESAPRVRIWRSPRRARIAP
jgi:choline kinase